MKMEQIFKNEEVYIVGGGTSLQDFDFKLLENKNTIVLNKAMLYVPNADVLWYSDVRFYRWFIDEINSFKGLVFTKNLKHSSDKITVLKDSGHHGLSLNPKYIKTGYNSGYAAINLAFHLGATTINLLGYDFYNHKNKTHFHDGYKNNFTQESSYNIMLNSFLSIVELLKRLDIKVYNYNRNSKLKLFPFKSLKSIC